VTSSKDREIGAYFIGLTILGKLNRRSGWRTVISLFLLNVYGCNIKYDHFFKTRLQ
jgi:hypothetical protein